MADGVEVAVLAGGDDAAAALPDLVALLVDSVRHGASVGFLGDLTPAAAEAFWRSSLPAAGTTTVVARDGGRVVGCAQLLVPQKANAAPRAEVAKVLVHSGARRRGIATLLLAAVEAEALRVGRTTLLLDTETGSPAERLYAGLGWEVVGVVPAYFTDPRGEVRATTFMTKRLGG